MHYACINVIFFEDIVGVLSWRTIISLHLANVFLGGVRRYEILYKNICIIIRN